VSNIPLQYNSEIITGEYNNEIIKKKNTFKKRTDWTSWVR